ncbi:hypothetical protein BGX28_007069 [Mortierella sp. GBA30]|nr:hypothetical protein BGX28_007069 [Mortierella sp. GBA30]
MSATTLPNDVDRQKDGAVSLPALLGDEAAHSQVEHALPTMDIDQSKLNKTEYRQLISTLDQTELGQEPQQFPSVDAERIVHSEYNVPQPTIETPRYLKAEHVPESSSQPGETLLIGAGRDNDLDQKLQVPPGSETGNQQFNLQGQEPKKQEQHHLHYEHNSRHGQDGVGHHQQDHYERSNQHVVENLKHGNERGHAHEAAERHPHDQDLMYSQIGERPQDPRGAETPASSQELEQIPNLAPSQQQSEQMQAVDHTTRAERRALPDEQEPHFDLQSAKVLQQVPAVRVQEKELPPGNTHQLAEKNLTADKDTQAVKMEERELTSLPLTIARSLSLPGSSGLHPPLRRHSTADQSSLREQDEALRLPAKRATTDSEQSAPASKTARAKKNLPRVRPVAVEPLTMTIRTDSALSTLASAAVAIKNHQGPLSTLSVPQSPTVQATGASVAVTQASATLTSSSAPTTSAMTGSQTSGLSPYREHITNDGEGYRCELCPGERFGRVHDLKRHQISKHNEMTWPCDFCKRPFVRRDALLRHYSVKAARNDGVHPTVEEEDRLQEAKARAKLLS